MSLPLRFSADLDRDCVRKGGALEAVAKDQFDKKADKDQRLEDHLLYWGERQAVYLLCHQTCRCGRRPDHDLCRECPQRGVQVIMLLIRPQDTYFHLFSFQARNIKSQMQTLQRPVLVRCHLDAIMEDYKFNLDQINFIFRVNCVICLKFSIESIE